LKTQKSDNIFLLLHTLYLWCSVIQNPVSTVSFHPLPVRPYTRTVFIRNAICLIFTGFKHEYF